MTARYWRYYIPGYTWAQKLNGSTNTFEDVTTGKVHMLGYTAPGLHFLTPPASGKAVTASYQIDVPFHTANNLLKFQYSVVLTRG